MATLLQYKMQRRERIIPNVQVIMVKQDLNQLEQLLEKSVRERYNRVSNKVCSRIFIRCTHTNTVRDTVAQWGHRVIVIRSWVLSPGPSSSLS